MREIRSKHNDNSKDNENIYNVLWKQWIKRGQNELHIRTHIEWGYAIDSEY